jgi:hypothetical protein
VLKLDCRCECGRLASDAIFAIFVKEYLTSNRIAEGRVSRYYIRLKSAHIFVTQACLSFLLQLDMHVTKRSVKEFTLA